eukprot:361336-Chlamydomonas_euryale.AAC.2
MSTRASPRRGCGRGRRCERASAAARRVRQGSITAGFLRRLGVRPARLLMSYSNSRGSHADSCVWDTCRGG